MVRASGKAFFCYFFFFIFDESSTKFQENFRPKIFASIVFGEVSSFQIAMSAEQLATLAGLTADQRAAIEALARNLGLGPQAQQAGVPHVKAIPCASFSIGKDFDTYIVHFVDNIRAVYNITGADDRLDDLCLQWLSSKLEPGPTRQVYENLGPNAKNNWGRLKAALSEAFTDDKDRLDFLSRMDAHQRTPEMSLRTYKDSLLAKMDKYQAPLKAVQAEWNRTACQRFREGLKNPLLKAHLMMNCPEDSTTIEEAFKVATSWENTLSQLNKDTKQLPGSTAFVSALMGIPANNSDAVTPKMGALGIAAMDRPMDERVASLETKVKLNEMHVAEARDGIVNLKAQFSEMRDDIKSGFQSLRRDLGMYNRPVVAGPKPPANPYHQQGYGQAFQPPQPQRYAPPPQQHAPPPQPHAKYQNPPPQNTNAGSGGQPGLVQGLTPGSRYVNNVPGIVRNRGLQNTSAPPRAPAQAAPTHPAPPVLGAMESTGATPDIDADGVDWSFANPMAMGNIGNGWQSFPTEVYNAGYVQDPKGLYVYPQQEGQEGFQSPAEVPGGPSPAH